MSEHDESEVLHPVPLNVTGEVVQSRAQEAYDLRMGGMSLSKIADRLGYSSGIAVARAINEEMKKDIADLNPEVRESLLALELARLDRLQEAVWSQAMYGDPKSVSSVLSIMDMRAKRLQFEAVEADTGQATILVVGGLEEEYVEKLKGLVEGS